MKKNSTNRRRSSRSAILRTAEVACWALGVLLLGHFAQMTLIERWHARRDFDRFMLTTTARADTVGVRAPEFPAVAAPDQSLWSEARRAAYLASLTVEFPTPIAILRVPSVGIEVPVYPGTGEAVLDRGAGWVEGTARVEDGGNIGIAAHRDSYFRPLKDIADGALIELQTPGELRRFRITYTKIVEPDDTASMRLTDEDSLTLVTCYPFYFVGHAPRRFIVRAVAIDS